MLRCSCLTRFEPAVTGTLSLTITSNAGSEATNLLTSLKFSVGAAAFDNLAAFLAIPAKSSPPATGAGFGPGGLLTGDNLAAAAIAAGLGGGLPCSALRNAIAIGVVS